MISTARPLLLVASCLLVALVALGCGRGGDCRQYADRLGPCSEEWKCPSGDLRWTCDGGECECVEAGVVKRRYASTACPFQYGDGAEQAGEANAACGWSIPYNP